MAACHGWADCCCRVCSVYACDGSRAEACMHGDGKRLQLSAPLLCVMTLSAGH